MLRRRREAGSSVSRLPATIRRRAIGDRSPTQVSASAIRLVATGYRGRRTCRQRDGERHRRLHRAGAGADIWGTSDAFDAVVRSLQGDATLVARVVDEENTNMFAKAGVTFGLLSPGSARVILDTRPDGNIEFMARLADGAAMSFIGGASTTFPVWLRLVRSGDQFRGSISSDGTNWTRSARSR